MQHENATSGRLWGASWCWEHCHTCHASGPQKPWTPCAKENLEGSQLHPDWAACSSGLAPPQSFWVYMKDKLSTCTEAKRSVESHPVLILESEELWRVRRGWLKSIQLKWGHSGAGRAIILEINCQPPSSRRNAHRMHSAVGASFWSPLPFGDFLVTFSCS